MVLAESGAAAAPELKLLQWLLVGAKTGPPLWSERIVIEWETGGGIAADKGNVAAPPLADLSAFELILEPPEMVEDHLDDFGGQEGKGWVQHFFDLCWVVLVRLVGAQHVVVGADQRDIGMSKIAR